MQNKNIGFIIIILLLVTASAFSLNIFFRQKMTQDKFDIRSFPNRVGQWQGKDLKIEEYEYDILRTRNLILREYTNSPGEKIFLFIIYSETDRSVFHPPEVCLIGSGIAIVDKQPEKIDYRDKSFFVNKLYLEKGKFKEVALYCYKAGSLYTSNFYIQQAYLAMNQIFGRRVPGATIRVSTSALKGEKEALSTLQNFLKEIRKIIDSSSEK